ncbi:hypothetical protein ACWGH2_29050 [Streptomyces sp. NPDC054871]
MATVNISVAEPLVPLYEKALQALGGTDIERSLPAEDEDLIVITVNVPGVPGDAHTMKADITFAAGRPAHIEKAIYYDGSGMKLATLSYP